MIDPVSYLCLLLGINPNVVVPMLPIVMLVCNYLARLIPDDSTGALWFLNRVFSVLGLYVSNRISKNISVNEVVTGLLPVAPVREESESQPNLFRRNGFVDLKLVGIIFVAITLPVLVMGCATTQQAAKTLCANRDAVIAAAEKYCAIYWDSGKAQ